MLYNLIITPLETIVEWVFNFFSFYFASFGVIGAVFGVSFVINLLALPLYNIADDLQEKERNVTKALEPRVKRIKKAFKGNERFMMLSTYYRQNNYHPLYALRSALSIIIQIPFFIAAYHFLSNCEALRGSSFWIFKDLGKPDGLLHIGKFPIHILPILMTVINLLSGAVYAKKAPMKEKVQIVLMAAFFLVILYNSPSGLVIYWILNNVFSLVKNIVKKTKKPGLVLHLILSLLLIASTIYLLKGGFSLKRLLLLIFALCFSVLPFVIKFLKKKIKIGYAFDKKIDFSIMITSSLALAFLCGFLLPSSVIATSPAEFSFLGNTDSPLSYIWHTFCVFLGFFFLWPLFIYKIFGERVKKIESFILPFVFFIALVNAYWLTSPYGTLSPLLEVENPFDLKDSTKKNLILFVLASVVIAIVIFLVRKSKFAKFIPFVMISICVAELSLGFVKVASINESYKILSQNKEKNQNHFEVEKEFALSKNGENVLIFLLDRGINSFVPQIFEEFPEIKKQFEGFTYFPNALSYSGSTVTGAPALYGGYEYSPEKMNEREDELLRDKHNEALMIMPRLFAESGFETTVLDLPWPNYTGGGDLSFAKNYPEIKISEIKGKYARKYSLEKSMTETPIDVGCRNAFIDFTFMQCLPSFTRINFYLNMKRNSLQNSAMFLAEFTGLYYLPQMTDLTSEKNTFSFIYNNVTHDVFISLEDDYETASQIQIKDESVQHYHANIAALKQLGKYFDYLRENDVYDNTRIIVVSDHGRGQVKNGSNSYEVMSYSALFMVKDFASSGEVKTDETFMTNADTLFVAKEGIDLSNVNPYTKKTFVQEKQNGVNVYPCIEWNALKLTKDTQFNLNKNGAFHVEGDIYKKENWIPLTDWEKQNGGAQ